MDTCHWIILGLTAALMTALYAFAICLSPRRWAHRWGQRVFWAAALLWIGGGLGGLPLNGVNLLATAALGAPGYAALFVLSRL